MTAARSTRRSAAPGTARARVALVTLLALLGALCLQAPAASATSYGIAVSTSPTRGDAVPLEGARVHDTVHAFTTPDTDVAQVRFFVDDVDRAGTPRSVERSAPFDLGGSNKDGTARPFDTRTLPDGPHTLTAELTLRSGAVQVVHAAFTVDQASARLVADPGAVTLKAAEGGLPATASSAVTAADGAAVPVTATSSASWLAAVPSGATTPLSLALTADPAGLPAGTHRASVELATSTPGYPGTSVAVTLSVVATSDHAVVHSADPGRTAPAELHGATVHGPLYAFTTPDTGVSSVRFFLDDPERTKAPLRLERGAPYDLGGSSRDGLALPYDTTGLADGEHTLTAELTLLSGVVTVETATFRTANAVPRLLLSTGSLALTSDGGAGASGAVTLDAADSGPTTFTATSDRPWLSVRADRTTTPAVLAVTADPAGLAEGTSTGTVTASAPGLRSATLAVTLTVTRAAATVAFTPATLSLSSDGAAAVSAGASLSASTTAASFSLRTDVPWLTATPASGTTPSSLTVTADPAGLAAGSHTGTVTATASDGRSATLPTTLVVESDTCAPVACEDIRVDLPYSLDFSQDVGGVTDRAGLGTGFTSVDPPSAGSGYLPANLALDPLGSALRVTTTAGLASAASDSQDNALAVGIDAPGQVTLIKTTLVRPAPGSGKFEQAGVWFGNGEDDYDKLVVTSTSAGTQVEHTTEVGGVLVKTVRSTVQDLARARVELVLRADPVARTVTAYWSADGGAQHELGAHAVPGEFFSFDAAGIDPRIGTRSFAGILTSHRRSTTPRTYVFDDFSVEQAPATGGGGTTGPSAAFAFDRTSTTVRFPTSMVFGPDGRLYVTEMFGKIHALTLGPDREVVADEVITTLGQRLTLGITVDPASTASSVVLWVSHSSPSADDGEVNSSTVTRLSGPGFTTRDDVITGLPRAKANHAVNSLHFGPDGRLYVAAGGNTGAGAPNTANTEFGDRPEQPLSAALLVADVKAPGFSGACATPLHSSGVPSTCDVRTFATGLRNMYDFVFHSNGQVYGSDNGLGVTGSFPPRPAPDCTGLADAKLHNPGNQPDSLRRLTDGSYHGHPNPYRDECVFDDGTAQGVPALPTFTPRMHSLGSNKSANGTVEYRGDAFCGALHGDLLLANYSLGDDITRVRLSPDGLSVVGSEQLASGFQDPLPLAVAPDGTIWVGEFGGDRVTALVPRDQGCWTTRTPLPADLLDVGGTALDGRLFVVGGKSAGSYNSTAMHVYDPSTDRWSTAPALPQAVENPAVVAHDGRLWVFGGSTAPFSGAGAAAWAYDPGARTWTALPAMPTARSGAAAQVLGDRIVVAGGMGADGASVATVEALDPRTLAWSALAPMGTRRDNAGAAVLGGRLHVFGGRTREASGATVDGTLTSVESYDPATGTWTARAPMPTGRRTMVVATLDGTALVMGGEVASDGAAFAQNEQYDPVTDTWRRLTPMPTGRHGAAAGVVDGTVYVAAGGPRGGGSYSGLLEAFRFGRP